MNIRFFCMFFLSLFALQTIGQTKLKVGIFRNYPLLDMNEKGEAEGVFVEFLEEIAKKEGWELQYVLIDNVEEYFDKLQNKEVDILPDVVYSWERSKEVDFSEENILATWAQLYANKNISIESLADLEGKRVAVVKGTYFIEDEEIGFRHLMQQLGIDYKLIEVKSFEDVFKKIENNEADAGIVGRIFGDERANQFTITKTSVAFAPITLRYAYPKNSQFHRDIRAVIDAYFKKWKQDHQSPYYTIIDKYFGERNLQFTPIWIWWVLGVVLLIGVSLAFISLFLQKQINKHTKHLKTSNQLLLQQNEKIAQIHKRMSLVYNNTQDMICLLKVNTDNNSTNFDIEIINDRFYDFFNIPKNTTEKNWLQVLGSIEAFLPEQKAEILERYTQTITEHSIGSFEDKIQIGSLMANIEMNLIPILDEKHKCTHILHILRDITKKVHTQKILQSTLEQLKDNQNLLDNYFNNTPALIYIKDISGKIIKTNHTFEELFRRYPPHTSQTLTPYLDYAISQNEAMVFSTGETQQFEEKMMTEDGKTNIYLSSKFPLRNEASQIYAIGAVSIDITERNKAQEELILLKNNLEKKVEERTKELQELLEKEKRQTEMLTTQEEEMRTALEDLQLAQEEMNYKNQELEVLSNKYKKNEEILRKAYNNIKERQATIDAQNQELQVREEELRQQNDSMLIKQKALDAANSRFELVQQAVGEGLWEVYIPENEVITLETPTWYSQKFMDLLGFQSEEFPPQLESWINKIHPEQRTVVFLQYKMYLKGKSPDDLFNTECLIQTKEGVFRWFSARGKVQRNALGKVVREAGALSDIHLRKEALKALEIAKQQAEMANKAKSEFLANMSHDLRTPLNGILGYAQILKKDKSLGESQKEGIEVIKRSGEHLHMLINDILHLSKIEAGKLELEYQEVNFYEFLKGIADLLRIWAEEKKLIFNFKPLTQLPKFIKADDKRLRQVLLNLLNNAIKFTDKGEITFLVEAEKIKGKIHSIRFEIEDTGSGIPEDKLQEIFKPFQQVNNNKHRSEGTGLGLAISTKLVRLMGGEIFVKSTLNKGSTFWFTIEIAEIKPKTTIKVVQTEIIGYKGVRRKILIVDDKAENREVLEGFVKDLGFQTFVAANGQEGFEKAIQHKPDLILLDLVMPVMDGFEMAKLVRETSSIQDIKIIACSASVYASDRYQSIYSGCNDFIPKPVQQEELYNKIEKHLQLKWIYATSNKTFENIPDTEIELSEEITAQDLPNSQILKRIYQLALQGDIQTLLQELEMLRKQDTTKNKFTENIKLMAQNYQMKKIRDFIKNYI